MINHSIVHWLTVVFSIGSIYIIYKILSINKDFLQARMFTKPATFISMIKHFAIILAVLIVGILIHLYLAHYCPPSEMATLGGDLICLVFSITVLVVLYQALKEIGS